ncbi:MAG: hybrid sensor histidine kinase/response regulator [Burkholderiales bacterium]|nr:hybrid sensor histidine kinase/response regulator [Burkholderiales bacterium]
MATKDDDFLEQLRATFEVEAAEHLRTIASGLLELEKGPAPGARQQIVETTFRAAHSLKGAARAVDFAEIESLCQSMEDALAAWKRQEAAPSSSALDTLHRTVDAITAAMTAPRSGARAAAPAAYSMFDPPARHAGVAEPAAVEPAPTATAAQETSLLSGASVRISVARLDARLMQAEEMLAVKLSFDQRVGDLGELAQHFEAWRGEWAAVEAQARMLRQQVDRPAPGGADPRGLPWARMLDFLDWNQEQLKSVEGRLAVLSRAARQDRYAVGKLVDDLLDDTKSLLLQPFDTISASFPRLVRDLCRDRGKEADLQIAGEHIEIDKRILEEVKDPLIHLLRNSVDHGIETAEERARRGKPARATIRLEVAQVSGNKIRLTVSDDGAGIDTARVKAAAIRQGLVSADEAARLDDPQAYALIFRSELSTSPTITRLSGRGLGLAIVQEQAGKLGGSVSVESQIGMGTRFRIELPATRATFRGVLVEAGGRLFVLPTTQVERVARVRPDDIRTVEGRDTIAFDGRAVALVGLANVLELPPAEPGDVPPAGWPVIILGTNGQSVAFALDAVLDEQEILVKPLVKPLTRVRNVAAATVLGSGQVVPILNVADLLKSARQRAGGASVRRAGEAAPAAARAAAILVAEDSITSRMLLKGILESAGYRVKVAVDGMEAYTMLRAERFELLVSDVEMPRLNGFDLTAKIRADGKLAELPVVLVSALETREDRERGIDAGANAYVVKSSFDQSNLLEAVRRLV